MRKALLTVMAAMVLSTCAYAGDAILSVGSQPQIYNNHRLSGSTGERGVTAVAEMINAIIQTAKEPAPIYQVPAIIVPRYGDQPFAGYFGANYIADYKDATNGLLVVKGNIQILLPNDGYARTVEQKGNLIIITNVNTGKKMTVKIQ